MAVVGPKNVRNDQAVVLSLLAILSLLTIFIILTSALLLKEPSVWPDEPVYADVAYNFIKEGRFGSDLLKEAFPGIEKRLYGYPPVFYSFLIFWFKLFGFSIVNQRLLSVVISFGFLIGFYFLAKLFFKNKSPWLPVLSFGTLIIDFTFLKGSRISRPEIFILFFGVLSYFLFLKALETKIDEKSKSLLIIGSGISASLAFLSHLIGILVPLSAILFFLISEKLKVFKSKKFYLFIFSSFVPIIIWFISISPHLNIWKEQVFPAVARKSLELPWIWIAFHTQPLAIKILYLSYIFITLVFIVFSLTRGKKSHLFLGLILIVCWLFSTYGKMFWYFIFPIPFIYLALSILLSEATRREYKLIIAALCLITVLSNLKLQATMLSTFGGENYSYNQFVEQVLRIVPDNKTVFLSSIPDPFYGFKARGKNKLHKFPSVEIPKENYFKILNDSDFIVYTGSQATMVFGDFLRKYIVENQAKIYKIGEPSQYQALVIELKPKNQRITSF